MYRVHVDNLALIGLLDATFKQMLHNAMSPSCSDF